MCPDPFNPPTPFEKLVSESKTQLEIATGISALISEHVTETSREAARTVILAVASQLETSEGLTRIQEMQADIDKSEGN